MLEEKFILDACCGARMFWFNKKHPNALYVDIRVAEKGHKKTRPNHCVKPDFIMDFRKLNFNDESFQLVVFDPPHMHSLSETSLLRQSYGVLNKETWKDDLKKGFEECYRVLKINGVLIFKWNEAEIKLKEVLGVFSKEPLFGHTTGSNSKTHWLCFMKLGN